MAIDERQENYQKVASAHHAQMIDFVKYGETKNAALVTFCSIWIGSILTVLRFNQTLPLDYHVYLPFVLPILLAAMLISLWAFVPRFMENFYEPVGESKNLLYWGDIASMCSCAYAAKLREFYYPPEDASYTKAYFDDLEIQISIQAKTANRKFKIFNIAIYLVFAAFLVFLLPAVLNTIQIILSLVFSAGQR